VVTRDFASQVAGRYRKDGPHSAEALREDILAPALRLHDRIRVVIDGPAYSMSFLEEAFGGLVRQGYLTPENALNRIEIIGGFGYKYTVVFIQNYIRRARPEPPAVSV
jgi:hypothetical protein